MKWLLSLLLISHFSISLAHTKNEVLTEIVLSDDKKSLLIRHQVPFHDAEHATKQIFGVTKDILNNSFDRSHMVNYVVENFKVALDNGQQLAAQLDDYVLIKENLTVFQRLSLSPMPKKIVVQQNVFRKVWPNQSNILRVKLNDKEKSYVFSKDIEQHIIFLNLNSSSD